MTKTTITYLIDKLDWGGAQTGMIRLIDGIDHSKYDVTVVPFTIQSDVMERHLPADVSVHELGITSHFQAPRLKQLWSILEEADVLVCSLWHSVVIGSLLGRILDVPLILSWKHNTDEQHFVETNLLRVGYRNSDHILVDSEAVATVMRERYSIDPGIVSVLPLAGVDIDQFTPDPSTPKFRTGDVITVGTVGRFVPQKGYIDLFECADRLGPSFEFHVVGGNRKTAVRTFNVAPPENVVFHDFVVDITNLYNSVDIYFQPSRYEGLCITVIEAMACGLPVVASAVGGIRESTVHGTTGYLASPGAIDEFTRYLTDLSKSSIKRRRFGKNGRDRVEARYSKRALVEKFSNVIESEIQTH